MSAKETSIVHEIMVQLSKSGVVLFKNVRGMFLTLDGKRKVRAGLQAAGASDLVGFDPVIITPDMVGKKIAVFTVIEVKTDTGSASPEQDDFIAFVLENGGKAGIARNVAQALKIAENRG